MLYVDEEINSMDSNRPEVWTQVHVWRTLGQLGSEASIIRSFDTLHEDDYAQSELPEVISMIGPVAIPALVDYWQPPDKNQYSYCLALARISHHRSTAAALCGTSRNFHSIRALNSMSTTTVSSVFR
jgi:hypothetical protein